MPRLYPKGVRRTPTGLQVYAKIRGKFRSTTIAIDSTPKQLADARDKLIAKWKYGAKTGDEPVIGPTFQDDATAYKALVKGMPSYADRVYHVDCWADAFGERQRSTLTGKDIRGQLERWRLSGRIDGKGLSAASLNRRRTALMSLFTMLDGRSAANPVKDVPKYDESGSDQIRAVDPRIMYRIIARIGRATLGKPPSKTRARLRLMLWTGWPHAQIMRLTPEDIDWRTETVKIGRRLKGKGAKARSIPLLPGAVVALKAFVAADAFGPFSQSAMHSAFARALAAENAYRAHCTPPRPPIAAHPYTARHVFGTELARHVKDERAIQAFMLHGTPQQTRRYTEGATESRLLDARDALIGKVLKQLR